MNAEEVTLIRDIRRMFDKMPIDTGRMEISVMRGHITLSGTVRSLRSHPLVKVKETVDELERRLRRDYRIKQLNFECRIVEAEKKEIQHFNNEHFVHEGEVEAEEEEILDAVPPIAQ